MREIKPCTEAGQELIHAGLRAYNRSFCTRSADLSCLVEEDGRVVGGCDAFLLEDLAMVDVLWVDESCRGQGIGAKLLAYVEQQAAQQGAGWLELNTFGFQAPGFYEKQGYERIGVLEPAMGGQGHYFYAKRLRRA